MLSRQRQRSEEVTAERAWFSRAFKELATRGKAESEEHVTRTRRVAKLGLKRSTNEFDWCQIFPPCPPLLIPAGVVPCGAGTVVARRRAVQNSEISNDT